MITMTELAIAIRDRDIARAERDAAESRAVAAEEIAEANLETDAQTIDNLQIDLRLAWDEADALRAENDRLRAQLDASEQAARITELQAACTRHEAAAREARAALRPFAEADGFDESFADDDVFDNGNEEWIGYRHLTIGHFRAARQLIEAHTKGTP